MIDALIQGKLFKQPQQRTAKNGNTFAVCLVRTPTRNGDALFISCIAFADEAQRALLALSDGDAVAIAGELTPGVYVKDGEPRPAADMLAHKVLSAYHVTRKRKAITAPPGEPLPEDASD